MEVDTKTVVIIVLGLVLMFMLFSDSGSIASTKGSSSSTYQSGYSNPQGGASPAGIQTIDNLPDMVGGC